MKAREASVKQLMYIWLHKREKISSPATPEDRGKRQIILRSLIFK